jgi:hypothetical protein
MIAVHLSLHIAPLVDSNMTRHKTAFMCNEKTNQGLLVDRRRMELKDNPPGNGAGNRPVATSTRCLIR